MLHDCTLMEKKKKKEKTKMKKNVPLIEYLFNNFLGVFSKKIHPYVTFL